MSGGMRRRLIVMAVTVVGLGASAGLASASSGFRLSVTPRKLAPGGKVTISTTPRLVCRLTITIAKKPFSHVMRYGWTQVTIPRSDRAGRVPVKVICGGHAAHSFFIVK